jgi:hypothetical protein
LQVWRELATILSKQEILLPRLLSRLEHSERVAVAAHTGRGDQTVTNWLKLERGDSLVDDIADILGNPNSLNWLLGDTFHAWLDLDTSNWIVVFAAAEQDSLTDRGGVVETRLYLAAQNRQIHFKVRLRERYDDRQTSSMYGDSKFNSTLASVAAKAAVVFRLPFPEADA